MSTITLKNVPKDLHSTLKRQAELHHRSLNNEIISCLESFISPPAKPRSKAEAEALLAETRALREKIGGYITEKEIQKAKEWGRE